jgi:hypothetical protein
MAPVHEHQGRQVTTEISHKVHAEQWVYKAANVEARGPAETAVSCAAIAQVHALLACEEALQLLAFVSNA